ncbi:MAG: tetratricopeptide repeat protein [Acidobacteria bacterium]|uniref:Tetratricopeptide repeat protein n=1 Tax=Candidatus Polarisedimenticola svalbardensis TaxID=2886004 RepID=A0A8J6Y4G7_9BACT|nr:tetratricopeptide repeat protein [Candidatus Polarisedimenticola svalbardensis]
MRLLVPATLVLAGAAVWIAWQATGPSPQPVLDPAFAASLPPARQEIDDLLRERRREPAKERARLLYSNTRKEYGDRSVEAVQTLDLLVETLYRGGGFRDPETLALGEEAVALREELYGSHHPTLADSLHQLALLNYFDQLRDETLELAERALKIRREAFGEDHVDVAKSLQFLGTLYDEWGDSRRGRELLERSLRIREDVLGPDHPDLTESLNYLANCMSRLGEFEEALRLYQRAERICTDTFGPDSAPIVKIIYNQGQSQQALGRYSKARALYERSLKIGLDTVGPEHPNIFNIRSGLAALLYQLGDYASARAQYEQVLEGQARTYGDDQPHYAFSLRSLAGLHHSTGDLEVALKLYRQAHEILEVAIGPASPDVASAKSDIASVLGSLGRHEEARSLYSEALEIQERSLDPGHAALSTTLLGMAESARHGGDLQEAERLLERSLEILEGTLGQGHPGVVEPLLQLGELALSDGRIDVARARFSRARLVTEVALGPGYPTLARILYGDARALAREKKWTRAFATALKGAGIARSHVRATARSLPEREALTYAGHVRENLDLALTITADHGDSLSRSVDELWTGVIRARGLVLDEMAARHRTVAASSDARVLQLAADLQESRRRLANLIVRGAGDLPPEQYRDLIASARKERERAELALADRSRDFRLTQVHEETGLEELGLRLPAGTCLVAYFQFQHQGTPSTPGYMAFVLGEDRRNPQAVYLGTAAGVDDAVRAWRAEILGGAAGAGEMHRETGQLLREMVWDPLERSLVGADRVFVIPDGSLNLVNIAALPSGRDRYMVETGPTLHLLSAERDLTGPGELPAGGSGLLALGAPDFGHASGISNDRFQSHDFRPLPATLQEIDAVQSIWSHGPEGNSGQVMRLTGELATEKAFEEHSRGKRVIHLATHGFFLSGRDHSGAGDSLRGIGGLSPVSGQPDPNLLLLSGLAMAGANHRGTASGGNDGILTAEEIASMDLSGIDWAVLSACDTGVGEIQAGEGVFGLRRVFQVAGARTVIMSLWPVEDESTRDWMVYLYKGKFELGLDTAEAVRQATLKALGDNRETHLDPHPFFWAGFIASGDWR